MPVQADGAAVREPERVGFGLQRDVVVTCRTRKLPVPDPGESHHLAEEYSDYTWRSPA